MPEVTSALHLLHRAGELPTNCSPPRSRRGLSRRVQFVVLMAVAGSEEPSQTTLVQKTGIDRSTVADIVRRRSTWPPGAASAPAATPERRRCA